MQGKSVQVEIRVRGDPLPLDDDFLVRDPGHAGDDRIQPEGLFQHHAEVLHLGQVLRGARTICMQSIHACKLSTIQFCEVDVRRYQGLLPTCVSAENFVKFGSSLCLHLGIPGQQVTRKRHRIGGSVVPLKHDCVHLINLLKSLKPKVTKLL